MNETSATVSVSASFTPDDHVSMIHDEEGSRMTANDVPTATPFVDRTPTDPPHPPPAVGIVGSGARPADVSIDLEEPSGHQQQQPVNGNPSDATISPKKPSNSGGTNNPSVVPVRKTSILVVFMLLFAALALATYFFMHWYDPDLAPLPNRGSTKAANVAPIECEETKEVTCDFTLDDANALQIQIDILTEQNKQLAEQNKQLAEELVTSDELNDSLNASIGELKEQNEILSDSNDEYEALNGRLNATVAALKDDNAFLAEQVETYADLNEQLNITADRLEEQVDILAEQNKQLAEQLVTYDELNDRLNASIGELKEQNEILSDSNDEYEALNDRLNATVAALKEETAFLAEQVQTFADLNEQLNITADRLEDQVDELEDQVDKLSAENDRLDGLVDELDGQISDLSDLNDLLEVNVDQLEEQVDELTIENDRLEVSVDNLQTIASFLNETAGNLDETYDQVAEHLAEMISTNRMLVMETIENNYHQRVANWDCSFIDTFALEVFANDFNAPIPDTSVAEVMEYVNERVLSDLCLSQANFEQYLDDRYNGGDITTNRLVASVQRYTFDAMEHYFPDPDETGLTANDWAAADYKCENLTAEQQYIGA